MISHVRHRCMFASASAVHANKARVRLFHSTLSSFLADSSTSENTAAAAAAATEPEIPPIKWTTDRLTPEQILKVDKIFHKLLWLDMIESSMLNDVLNQRLGISMSPKQKVALERQLEGWERGEVGVVGGAGAGGSAGEAEEVQEEGPKLVDIKLAGFDSKSKIKVIKEVRSIAGLGLKEAKELVESAPVVLQKEIKVEDAEELQKRLQDVGAEIELV